MLRNNLRVCNICRLRGLRIPACGSVAFGKWQDNFFGGLFVLNVFLVLIAMFWEVLEREEV